NITRSWCGRRLISGVLEPRIRPRPERPSRRSSIGWDGRKQAFMDAFSRDEVGTKRSDSRRELGGCPELQAQPVVAQEPCPLRGVLVAVSPVGAAGARAGRRRRAERARSVPRGP